MFGAEPMEICFYKYILFAAETITVWFSRRITEKKGIGFSQIKKG
jgi:hypothetical protein